MIQHDIARKLLPIVTMAAMEGRTFTYGDAAEKLGRPRDNARAIAQVCDLLDAAAAYAGVPLLALITVTEADGELNRRAWREINGRYSRRDEIIAHSQKHNFSKTDFRSILDALNSLDGLSNKAAWGRVWTTIPDDEIYRRIAGVRNSDSTVSVSNIDAIDDIGSDEPKRTPSTSYSYARDPAVRNAVLERANGKCEYCGDQSFRRKDGSRYLESHHIIALANDGRDRLDNVIALCPSHHREAHFGEESDRLEREMISIVRKLAI